MPAPGPRPGRCCGRFRGSRRPSCDPRSLPPASYTFQQVQEHTDQIWKFQRHDLIEEYHSRPPAPPPFILLSHLHLVIKRVVLKIPAKRHKQLSEHAPAVPGPRSRVQSGPCWKLRGPPTSPSPSGGCGVGSPCPSSPPHSDRSVCLPPPESKLEKNEESALLSWETYLKDNYLQNQQCQHKQKPERQIQDIGNRYEAGGKPLLLQVALGLQPTWARPLGRDTCVLRLTPGLLSGSLEDWAPRWGGG